MKRRDLIRELEKMGCVLIRHGAKHDWYQNPRTKVSQPVPRHRGIKEHLARHIIKMLRDET
ncbi:MAG: type II toxin-antitoxin system HicA family toxin [Acidobacteria bacterium]|nr:MAG: type II toxin-antitoxin system HicA family toxin [Acidobacteriota bacterium]